MRAVQVESHSSTPVLVKFPCPHPGPGEIRIRIESCGLNFADLLILKGEYQDMPPPPGILGLEVAGVVDETGPDVTGFDPGMRVAAVGSYGGLAEYAIYPVANISPIPDSMSSDHAAALQIAYGTSHVALAHRARLQPKERLLVLGAAGGVGLTAVEIGKLMGATVIAVARGAEKLAIAAQAGADHVIDAQASDMLAQLRDLGGVDVVYDPVGGAMFETVLRACRPEARILLIGFASGTLPQIAPNHLLVKNVSVLGFYWGAYMKFDPGVISDSLKQLIEWHSVGRIRPHIGHIFPLEQASEGLELLRRRQSIGKIIVRP